MISIAVLFLLCSIKVDDDKGNNCVKQDTQRLCRERGSGGQAGERLSGKIGLSGGTAFIMRCLTFKWLLTHMESVDSHL